MHQYTLTHCRAGDEWANAKYRFYGFSCSRKRIKRQFRVRDSPSVAVKSILFLNWFLMHFRRCTYYTLYRVYVSPKVIRLNHWITIQPQKRQIINIHRVYYVGGCTQLTGNRSQKISFCSVQRIVNGCASHNKYSKSFNVQNAPDSLSYLTRRVQCACTHHKERSSLLRKWIHSNHSEVMNLTRDREKISDVQYKNRKSAKSSVNVFICFMRVESAIYL